MTWSSSPREGGPGRGTRLATAMMPTVTRITVPLLRLLRGRGASRMTMGAPLVLVSTIGRRTGRKRTTPVGHIRDGDDIIVMASNGGLPTTPAWILNLRDRPEAEVELRGERYRVTATFLEGEEWEQQWSRLIRDYPTYEQARRWASPRPIPLIRLHRLGPS